VSVVLVHVVVVGAVVVVVEDVVLVDEVVAVPWCRYQPSADAGATLAANNPATTAIVATKAATPPRYPCLRRCVSWVIVPPSVILGSPLIHLRRLYEQASSYL
jgi:hypothetical protein